jgi:hypothetical protein
MVFGTISQGSNPCRGTCSIWDFGFLIWDFSVTGRLKIQITQIKNQRSKIKNLLNSNSLIKAG